MNTTKNTTAKSRRLVGITLITAIAMLALLGIALAEAAKKRSFDGRVVVRVLKKGQLGQWREVDRVEGPLNFQASLLDAALGKEVTSDHFWSARSAKGRNFNLRLAGIGKVSADLEAGRFDLKQLPFELVVAGKKQRVSLDFTTESVNAPNGETLNGKRGSVINRAADVGVVGFSSLRGNDLIEEGNEAALKKENFIQGRKIPQELIFLVRAEGRVAAR
jgi:hypothetical protein